MTSDCLSAVSDGKANTRFNVGQMKFFTKGKEYWIHPIYDYYGANKHGQVINIFRGIPRKGNYNDRGYYMVRVGGRDKKPKTIRANRFIFECFNGIIPEGLVIDHINNKKDDNRLENLKLITQQQNCKKAAVNRDFSFITNRNGRKVKAINLETNEVSYYKSQYATAKHHNIAISSVALCCKGVYGYKTCKSKKDGRKYTFEYA